MRRILSVVLLTGVVWFMAVKPLLAEIAFMQYQKSPEKVRIAFLKYRDATRRFEGVVLAGVLAGNVGDSEPLFHYYRMITTYARYLRTAEAERENQRFAIQRALRFDGDNSIYNLDACQFSIFQKDFEAAKDHLAVAIIKHNGDLTPWSMYYMKGLLAFSTGNVKGAKRDFEKSLSYYHHYDLSAEKLRQVNELMEHYKGAIVKFK